MTGYAIRRAALAVAVTVLLGAAGPARADLSATETAIGGVELSAVQRRLVEDNPALAAVARDNPDALPALLEEIERLLPHARGGLRATPDYPPGAAATLRDNPDLAVIYRESPEAALDLLRLIREAAKKS